MKLPDQREWEFWLSRPWHYHFGEGEKKLYKNVWYRPVQDDEIARLALRYTLSKDLTAAIPPGDADFFWKAMEVARNFKPISLRKTKLLQNLPQDYSLYFRTR